MRQSERCSANPRGVSMSAIARSDIYELFCTAQELGTHFLVRTCVNRLAGDGGHTIADEMQETRVKGVHRVEVRDDKGHPETALVELRYRRIHVLPPIGKQKRYPALTLTVIHANERTKPLHRPAIEWKLITDLPVTSRAAAVEKLRWYAQRWKIEVFHKVLKSGCRAEEARLRTAERLVRLLAVFCILSWRVFWMTMMNRAAPNAVARLVFTSTEIALLDRLIPHKQSAPSHPRTLSSYLTKVARLGGYMARAKDPPPGNTVMWRGLFSAHRHHARRHARQHRSKMWVIESLAGGLPPLFLRSEIEECLVANADIAGPIIEGILGALAPPEDESSNEADTRRTLLRVAGRMKGRQGATR